MEVSEADEPSELRRIARALPRKRLMLVLLVIALNFVVAGYWRCSVVHKRNYLFHSFCTGGPLCPGCGVWTFTAAEWLEVVWPWK